jgi:hypothetical protein
MASILDHVLDAHGGRAAWDSAREVRAHVRAGGFLLRWKGAAGPFRDYQVVVSLDGTRSEFERYPGEGRRGIFAGDSVRIESVDGEVLEERQDPRNAFRHPRRFFRWDSLDALYFAGYAVWNYFTTPQLLTRAGVELREGEPWQEKRGESWRRLHATFPAGLPTHSREQTFYFDERGLLRRHDYTAEVNGSWAKAAHYSDDHREFDGLVFPTRRRVLPRMRSNRSRSRPSVIWMEIESVAVSRG